MIKIRRHIILLMITLALYGTSMRAIQRLSDLDFTSASVLPVFTKGRTTYLIVAREVEGKSRGTYDDFGGGREKNENHPITTAAREFCEEAITPLTIGLDIPEIQRYLDSNHTTFIICHTKNQRSKSVTYIIQFNRYYKELLRHFYAAREKATQPAYREKDRIAVIKWATLTKVLSRVKNIKKVTVQAWEIDQKTGKWIKKRIKLRSSFVRKFKPFFTDRLYEKDVIDRRVRFYD